MNGGGGKAKLKEQEGGGEGRGNLDDLAEVPHVVLGEEVALHGLAQPFVGHFECFECFVILPLCYSTWSNNYRSSLFKLLACLPSLAGC